MNDMTSTMTLDSNIGEAVASLDATLSSGKFGDSQMMRGTTDGYFAGLGRMFAKLNPDLGVSWPGQFGVRERTIVRGMLDEAMIVSRGGFDAAFDTLTRMHAVLDDQRRDGARGRDIAISDADWVPVLMDQWNEGPIGKAIHQRYDVTLANDGLDYPIGPARGSTETVTALKNAMDLLPVLLPNTAAATISLVDGIALVSSDFGQRSAFINGTPLMIFFNERLLSDPVRAAEYLLHECLHQKLNDIRNQRWIMRLDYHDDTSRNVPIPWGEHNALRHFSVDRSLAAGHVYTHLVLLYLSALAACRSGRIDADEAGVSQRLQLIWARADHITEELAAPSRHGHETDLEPEGLELVEWLRTTKQQLGAIELSPGTRLESARGDWDET